jgi:predicted homoserine dehydrogenase-like protein
MAAAVKRKDMAVAEFLDGGSMRCILSENGMNAKIVDQNKWLPH